MGNRTDRISDLEWEVQKLTEIKDKFKRRAKQLKNQLNMRTHDHVEMVGLMLPQKGIKEDVDRLYIEFESNLTGDYFSVCIEPYDFITWIGKNEVEKIKDYIKVEIDKL